MGITMTNKLFILFSILTILSLYTTYSGLGLEEIQQENPRGQSSRVGSSHSYSSGGWSFGK
jgi:hypothetical protein